MDSKATPLPYWKARAEARAAAEAAAAAIQARGPLPPPAAELDRALALLQSHPWIFAKRMADNPHCYTLRRQWSQDDDFVWVVRFIRSYGYVERFPHPVKGWPYVQMNIGNYKYWTMGAPCEPGPYDPQRDTILINRKPLAALHAYHSALTIPLAAMASVDRFAYRGCLAFVHDILASDELPFAGLPREFEACDLFWCDPPWRQGYEEFNRRVGIASRPPFREFVRKLDRIARDAHSPVVYIVGRSFSKQLTADGVVELRHNGAPALAAGYRMDLPAAGDSQELLAWLAERFQCVGDFLAGYGRTGQVFAAQGKRFVLSDFNPRCIGFIAEHAASWFPRS